LGGSGYNATWCTNAAQRRINILQNALDTLLDSASPAVRIGIGKFNYYAPNTNSGSGGVGQAGGRILVPVTELTSSTRALIRSKLDTLNGAGNQQSASAHNAQPVGDTPTAGAFSEAARYMLGMEPKFGTYRITKNEHDNCPAGSYCYSERVWEGFSYTTHYLRQDRSVPYKCQDGESCTGHLDIIQGSNYVSPMNMNNMCETNHIILFTDGAPSANDNPVVTDVTSTNCGSSTSSYTCQVSIASYLNNDNNTKNRRVLTHNIGLYMGDNKDNMEAVSDAGGGATANADSAEPLIEAFLNNLDLIDGQSRSISAPGIAVNT